MLGGIVGKNRAGVLGNRVGFGSQTLQHHRFDLRPDPGIALTLCVRGSEVTVEHGSTVTLDRSLSVIGEIVAEDLGLGRIGSRDLLAAMDEAGRLVEIYGFSNVVRDDGIILPRLINTIHLDGQQDRDMGPA